jgi:23S rRNA pseudouridine1911/1915/1917 synthase
MTEQTVEPNSPWVGQRLDRYLADACPELSRTDVQQAIREGKVFVSGKTIRRPAHRVREGDTIRWDIAEEPILVPKRIPLSILYEDDALIAVDKPTGLVVHPGAGTTETTLVEGLLADRALPVSDDPARPGVVHRLDKETSGVIVFAKTLQALDSLKHQFADRTAKKHYIAVADGTFDEQEGLIDAPISRDPTLPQRRSIQAGGRRSETEFTVLSNLGDASLLWVRPRTGRTHQIRVHFRYIGHPIRGDDKYGGSRYDRLMLHAWRLQIRHPVDDSALEFRAPVPDAFPVYAYDALDGSRMAPRK